MSRQSNITFDDFTNFLNSGAILRWQGQWYLFWDFSLSQTIVENQAEPIQGLYSCDFITGHIFYQKYNRSAMLTHQDLKEIVEFYKTKTGAFYEGEQTDFDPQWFKLKKDLFLESFTHVKQAIALKKIKKAVPLCFQNGLLKNKVSPSQKLNFISSLLDSEANLIPYGQWIGDAGFVGQTPELFFHVKNNVLHTMALAGTSSKDFPKKDFLADPKERLEHALVVQDICEKIQFLGDCEVSETEVCELPSLNHLKTEIKLTANSPLSVSEMIKKMHPTSALGIYPKTEYWQEFVSLPFQSERNGFGAPWGFVQGDPINQAIFVVSIRRLEWEKEKVRIGAGCGIVEASQFEKEFFEIERKINSVKKAFVTKRKIRESFVND